FGVEILPESSCPIGVCQNRTRLRERAKPARVGREPFCKLASVFGRKGPPVHPYDPARSNLVNLFVCLSLGHFDMAAYSPLVLTSEALVFRPAQKYPSAGEHFWSCDVRRCFRIAQVVRRRLVARTPLPSSRQKPFGSLLVNSQWPEQAVAVAHDHPTAVLATAHPKTGSADRSRRSPESR